MKNKGLKEYCLKQMTTFYYVDPTWWPQIFLAANWNASLYLLVDNKYILGLVLLMLLQNYFSKADTWRGCLRLFIVMTINQMDTLWLHTSIIQHIQHTLIWYSWRCRCDVSKFSFRWSLTWKSTTSKRSLFVSFGYHVWTKGN